RPTPGSGLGLTLFERQVSASPLEYDRLMSDDRWPALRRDDWNDTYATLHMWSQVVGKVALALAPPINHAWGSSFEVTARGLSTHMLPYDDRSFTMEF